MISAIRRRFRKRTFGTLVSQPESVAISDGTQFRHSFRSSLDETGAPLTGHKELMGHASIQTTTNIYGKAITDSKRQAHSKVVETALNGSKSSEKALVSDIGS